LNRSLAQAVGELFFSAPIRSPPLGSRLVRLMVALALDDACCSVFLRFVKGCRDGALGCQHRIPFCVWCFSLIFATTQVSVQICLII